MSELKWNWAYYPYLDAPNKQKESALKAGYVKVVSKSEADKVIADKDKEIARLDDLAHAHNLELLQKENCIAELKEEASTAHRVCSRQIQQIDSNEQELRHHKYKRCVAMAKWCEAELKKLDYKASVEYTNKDVWRIATSYFTIWHKRWLELAEQFKEAKNAED